MSSDPVSRDDLRRDTYPQPDPGWPTDGDVEAAARAGLTDEEWAACACEPDKADRRELARMMLSAVSPPRAEGPGREAIARLVELLNRAESITVKPAHLAVEVRQVLREIRLALMERTEDE